VRSAVPRSAISEEADMAVAPDDPTFLQKLAGFTGRGGKLEQALAPFGGASNLGLALLANSGYSTTPRSFGQILGTSALQSQQAAQERMMEDVRKQYMEAQIKALMNKPAANPYGQYQPGDYTPVSWAKFLKTNDPADLERYATPRQEYSPSYQNVTRTLADGSTQQGTFNTRSGEYNWGGPVVPPGTKARVDAEGKEIGEAAGAQGAKAPAAASMDYVLSEFDKQIDTTAQGGVGGISGRAGSIFDYEDAQRFDNLREQLSTELRTVFRIPGEGTLSDREQAQYGVQLPSRTNTEKTNRQILRDIKERVRLRLQTPTVGGSTTSAPSSKYREGQTARNPTTGEIRVFRGGKWVKQ